MPMPYRGVQPKAVKPTASVEIKNLRRTIDLLEARVGNQYLSIQRLLDLNNKQKEELADNIQLIGKQTVYIKTLEDLVRALKKQAMQHSCVLTQGGKYLG